MNCCLEPACQPLAMIWRDKSAKTCVVFSKSRKKCNHQDHGMKKCPTGGLPFLRIRVQGNPQTKERLTALLTGFEVMGRAAPKLFVDMISGSITPLLSHCSPLVGTGLTKRHPNKTVVMCPGSVFTCSVFD